MGKSIDWISRKTISLDWNFCMRKKYLLTKTREMRIIYYVRKEEKECGTCCVLLNWARIWWLSFLAASLPLCPLGTFLQYAILRTAFLAISFGRNSLSRKGRRLWQRDNSSFFALSWRTASFTGSRSFCLFILWRRGKRNACGLCQYGYCVIG